MFEFLQSNFVESLHYRMSDQFLTEDKILRYVHDDSGSELDYVENEEKFGSNNTDEPK